MKNTPFFKHLVVLFIFGIATLIPLAANAAGNGACSGHSGVNCSVGADYDGSVICNDGWRNSSVGYSEVNECSRTTCRAYLPAFSAEISQCYAELISQERVLSLQRNALINASFNNIYSPDAAQQGALSSEQLQAIQNRDSQKVRDFLGIAAASLEANKKRCDILESMRPLMCADNLCGVNARFSGNQCICDLGYSLSLISNSCLSINDICFERYGTNTYGNWTNCYCNPGYQWNAGQTACVPVIPTPTPARSSTPVPPVLSQNILGEVSVKMSRETILALEAASAGKPNTKITNGHKGKILRQDIRGQAVYWYVNPSDGRRYIVDSSSDLLSLIQRSALFVSTPKLEKLKKNPTTVLGRFLVKTPIGEHLYVSPQDKKLYDMAPKDSFGVDRYDTGFSLLKTLSQPILDADLRRIPLGKGQ